MKPINKCLSFVLLAAVCVAVRGADGDKPEAWSVAPLLPAKSLLVVSVRDVQKSIEKARQTGLAQIINNPDVQNAFRTPMMTARVGMKVVEMQLGKKIEDLLGLISQGEVTFAVLGVDKKNDQGQPVPDLLLSIQGREKAHELIDEIKKRVEQLNAAAGGQLQMGQNAVGNVVVNTLTIPVPPEPITISYALCDGTIIAAVGAGRIEQVIAAHEKAKAGAKAADGAAPEILAEAPSFKKTLEKAGPSADFIIYANVESILKNPILDAQPKTEQQKKQFDASGIESIRAVSYSIEIKPKGIREVFFVDSPEQSRKGLLRVFEGDGMDLSALSAVPRNALFAAAFKLTPDKMFERMMELAAVDNPDVKAMVEGGMLEIGKTLDLDVKQALFNALSGQGVLSVSMPAVHPKLGIGIPQLLFTLTVKDSAALKNALASLRKAGGEKFDYTDITVADSTITTVREKFPEGHDPVPISYVVDKNDLILAFYPLAIREELRRRSAGADPAKKAANSLSDDEDFKSARSALSGSPQAMFYLDTGALAVAAYNVLIPIAQIRHVPPQIDTLVLPGADVLLNNLGGAVLGFSTDKDGIMAEGFSPTGALSIIALAVPAAMRMQGGQGFGGRAQMGGAAFGELTAVSRALKAYMDDNGGNAPAALGDLQPKYLPDVPADQLAKITYRGKQDADNKVVAFLPANDRGMVPVLLQNGALHIVPQDKLDQVLQGGYVGRMGKKNANAQGAVKPPKPPEF